MSFPMVALGEVLTERKEVPSAYDIANGKFRIISKVGFNDGKIQLRDDYETKTGMILIRPSDIVISGINAAKGAIALYDSGNVEPIAATIHYSSYIPKLDKVDTKFLWWLLRSNTFREILYEYLREGIKSELRAKRLLPIPVPLPSLQKQRCIVARIEELAAKVEEARGLRQRSLEEIEALIARASSQALDDGKWEIKRLEKVLAETPKNGLSPQQELESGGRPMLRINAVSSSPTRFIDLNAYKMVDVPDILAQPFMLQHGDVFIVRYNGDINRVAKAAIFKGTNDCGVIYPDKLMRLRVDYEKMIPDFLVYVLGSYRMRSQVEDLGKTTAGQIGISGSDAKSFQIPVPPLPEQRRIVAYLDELQAKVDALRRLQAETGAELDALMPAVLDKAFKGEM